MKKRLHTMVSFFPFSFLPFSFRGKDNEFDEVVTPLTTRVNLLALRRKVEKKRNHYNLTIINNIMNNVAYTCLSEEEREKGRGLNVASAVGRLPYSWYERGG